MSTLGGPEALILSLEEVEGQDVVMTISQRMMQLAVALEKKECRRKILDKLGERKLREIADLEQLLADTIDYKWRSGLSWKIVEMKDE